MHEDCDFFLAELFVRHSLKLSHDVVEFQDAARRRRGTIPLHIVQKGILQFRKELSYAAFDFGILQVKLQGNCNLPPDLSFHHDRDGKRVQIDQQQPVLTGLCHCLTAEQAGGKQYVDNKSKYGVAGATACRGGQIALSFSANTYSPNRLGVDHTSDSQSCGAAAAT